MFKQPPLMGIYGVMVAIALGALVPYILVTTGSGLYSSQVQHDLDTTALALELISGFAVAGYCFGALLAGDLINRIPQSILFFIVEALFILGAGLSAGATGVVMYGTGRVLSGFATGMLLVVALPPVIQRFPPQRMPLTTIFINVGFFGAVTAGPLIAGAVGINDAWRLFYWALFGVGAITWLLALLSLPLQPPHNPAMPWDISALVLGLAATALPFWGASELTAHSFDSVWFIGPMTAGVLAFVALIVTEYFKKNALSPVHQMATTFPVLGTFVAMIGGGVLVTLMELSIQFRMQVAGNNAFVTGLSFWPQVLAVLIVAVIVGLAMRTRWLPVLVLIGLLVLIAAGAMILVRPADPSFVWSGSIAGLLGIGAGATVAPGLFLAGFSLPSQIIGRIFAVIELIRSVADFILAPVLLKIARITSQGQQGLDPSGVGEAAYIALLLALGTVVVCVLVYLAGTKTLPTPNLQAWLAEGGKAVDSPLLFARLRKEKPMEHPTRAGEEPDTENPPLYNPPESFTEPPRLELLRPVRGARARQIGRRSPQMVTLRLRNLRKPVPFR